MGRIVLMVIAVAFGALSVGAPAQVRAEVALRAAIEQETVKGDLKGAIEAYRKIVDGYADNRAVRAQALVRMADGYRKLGDAQAKQVYERVIREFADQKEQVTIARARIGPPATDGALTARRVWTPRGVLFAGRESLVIYASHLLMIEWAAQAGVPRGGFWLPGIALLFAAVIAAAFAVAFAKTRWSARTARQPA